MLTSRAKRAKSILVRTQMSVKTVPNSTEKKAIVQLGTGGHKRNTSIIGAHRWVSFLEHRD
jgi:hypothetical protein